MNPPKLGFFTQRKMRACVDDIARIIGDSYCRPKNTIVFSREILPYAEKEVCYTWQISFESEPKEHWDTSPLSVTITYNKEGSREIKISERFRHIVEYWFKSYSMFTGISWVFKQSSLSNNPRRNNGYIKQPKKRGRRRKKIR